MGEGVGVISGDTHPLQCSFHRFNGLPSVVAINLIERCLKLAPHITFEIGVQLETTHSIPLLGATRTVACAVNEVVGLTGLRSWRERLIAHRSAFLAGAAPARPPDGVLPGRWSLLTGF